MAMSLFLACRTGVWAVGFSPVQYRIAAIRSTYLEQLDGGEDFVELEDSLLVAVSRPLRDLRLGPLRTRHRLHDPSTLR